MSVISQNSQNDAIYNDNKPMSDISLVDGHRRPLTDVVNHAPFANSFWTECCLNFDRIWKLWCIKTPLLLAREVVTIIICVLSFLLFTDKVGLESGCLEPFDRDNITNDELRAMFSAKSVR